MNHKKLWSKRLFWSLVPSGLLGIIFFSVLMSLPVSPASGTWEGGASGLAGITLATWLCFWCSLVAAIILRVMGNGEANRLYEEAMAYAQLHDWQTISTTAWRAYRRGTQFNVYQSVKKTSFILSIKTANDDHAATEGFERSLFAMEFGDWVVAHLNGLESVANIVSQQRHQWEETRALAIRNTRLR